MTNVLTVIILACQVHGTHSGDNNWNTKLYSEVKRIQNDCVNKLIDCVYSDSKNKENKLKECLSIKNY